MKLTDAERGMLASKIAAEVVDSIFGKRPGWAAKARAWIVENPEPEPEPEPEPDLPQIDLEEAIAARAPAAANDSRPEIPPRVLRWARWFVAAGWSYAETARLFEVGRDDLRLALGPSRRVA